MLALSPFHAIVLLSIVVLPVFGLIFVIPAAQILRRVGMSPWLALIYFVPVANIVCLWVFAFVRWPRDDAPSSKF
jgi:hypothetical protein